MGKDTVLVVESINGQELKQESGFSYCIKFPNSCAYRLAAKHDLLAEVLGTKISRQIIEYLDKETGEPVVQVYPDALHIFDGYEKNYMSRLNRAMRRDLNKEIALRDRLINEFIMSDLNGAKRRDLEIQIALCDLLSFGYIANQNQK